MVNISLTIVFSVLALVFGLRTLTDFGFKTSKISIFGWEITKSETNKDKDASTNVTVNGVGNATAVGSNAKAIINQQVSYTWINRDSLKSIPISSNHFRTELIFQANNGILPPSVCLDIQANTKVLGIDRGRNVMMGTNLDGIHCFSSPIRYETVGVITDLPPAITRADLVSN